MLKSDIGVNVSKIAEKIIETENKQVEETYKEELNNLKESLLTKSIDETEVNNHIKLYDGVMII